jgi:hypothetical protein
MMIHRGDDVAIEIEVPRRLPFKAARCQLINTFERLYVAAILRRFHWNIGRASRSSRLSRDRIHQLIGKHGLCERCDRGAVE